MISLVTSFSRENIERIGGFFCQIYYADVVMGGPWLIHCVFEVTWLNMHIMT